MGSLTINSMPDGSIVRLLAENLGAIDVVVAAGGGGGGALVYNYGLLSGGSVSLGGGIMGNWGAWFGPPPFNITNVNPSSNIQIDPSGKISVAASATLAIIAQLSGKVGAPGVAPFEMEFAFDLNQFLVGTNGNSDFSAEWEQTVSDAFSSFPLVHLVAMMPGDRLDLVTRCHNDSVLVTLDKWQFFCLQIA